MRSSAKPYKQKGFSLIELLIVVAIILIIAAIAIPNLLRSKIAANQASAVASMRTLNTSASLYSSSYGVLPTAISQLGGTGAVTSTNSEFIDSVLAGANVAPGKSGYTFTWAGGGTTGAYTINADPVSTSTGTVHYFTDTSLVIRSNTTAAATVNDTPIGQ